MANKIVGLFGLFLLTVFTVNGQSDAPKIVLNHFLLIVDSLTYHEILESKIMQAQFAFSHEKQLQGYRGIYIIGKDNYIEVFNPRSIENEYHEPRSAWICYTSMKANYVKKLNVAGAKAIDFSSDDEADYLSLYFHDSTNLISTWEMKKSHYENWSKKTFHDSVSFLSVDYNSQAESDSSKNYLFSNVAGIQVVVDKLDSVITVDYLKQIGYSATFDPGDKMRFTNSVDFIEIDFQKDVHIPTIKKVFMDLKKTSKSEQIEIGKSILKIEGKSAIWEFNLESNSGY